MSEYNDNIYEILNLRNEKFTLTAEVEKLREKAKGYTTLGLERMEQWAALYQEFRRLELVSDQDNIDNPDDAIPFVRQRVEKLRGDNERLANAYKSETEVVQKLRRELTAVTLNLDATKMHEAHSDKLLAEQLDISTNQAFEIATMRQRAEKAEAERDAAQVACAEMQSKIKRAIKRWNKEWSQLPEYRGLESLLDALDAMDDHNPGVAIMARLVAAEKLADLIQSLHKCPAIGQCIWCDAIAAYKKAKEGE